MKKNLFKILPLLFCLCYITNSLAQLSSPFQLAKPLVTASKTFFTDSTTIQMELDMAGVDIHYTFADCQPDENDSIYKKAVSIYNSTQLKAVAVHQQCINSEVAVHHFFKTEAVDLIEASITPMPNKSYAGDGVSSLFDLKKGSTDFKDGQWLGVSVEDMEIHFMFADSLELNAITASTFSDPRSWIFPPVGLEVWSEDASGTFVKIAETNVDVLSEMEKPNFQFQKCTFDPIRTNKLKVIIKNTGSIPDWHMRAGKGSWLFVDELLLEAR